MRNKNWIAVFGLLICAPAAASNFALPATDCPQCALLAAQAAASAPQPKPVQDLADESRNIASFFAPQSTPFSFFDPAAATFATTGQTSAQVNYDGFNLPYTEGPSAFTPASPEQWSATLPGWQVQPNPIIKPMMSIQELESRVRGDYKPAPSEDPNMVKNFGLTSI